jgi:Retrotransposon gag protein/G-patch domain
MSHLLMLTLPTLILKKMLENLQRQWNFTPGQGLGKMNQGPTEPLVLVENKGTQGIGFEFGKSKTTLTSNTSLKNTFIQDGFITPEGENCMDLHNIFNEICVLEGFDLEATTNREGAPSTSRANQPEARNNAPLGSGEQTRRLLLLQLEAFNMLIRLTAQGIGTLDQPPPIRLHIPHPSNPLFHQLQSLITQIEGQMNDLKASYAAPPEAPPEAPPQNRPVRRCLEPPQVNLEEQDQLLGRYDGKSCPIKHMISFCKLYESLGYEDNTMILLFGLTISGSDNQWFQSLSGKGPMTWEVFSTQFLHQFHHMWHTPSFADLLKITQGPTESFGKYVDRWFEVAEYTRTCLP